MRDEFSTLDTFPELFLICKLGRGNMQKTKGCDTIQYQFSNYYLIEWVLKKKKNLTAAPHQMHFPVSLFFIHSSHVLPKQLDSSIEEKS